MAPKLTLSIVVEMHTGAFITENKIAEHLDDLHRQLVALSATVTGELVVVSSRRVVLPSYARNVIGEGLFYYGLKKLGADRASGEIVVFLDADCRACPDYLSRLVAHFRNDRSLAIVAGITFYDGPSLLARINSVLSFGHLIECKAGEFPPAFLGHNVAIRRELVASPPFGPHAGRVGGGHYLRELAQREGLPFIVDKKLVVHHQDISRSLSLTLERHLREQLARFRTPDAFLRIARRNPTRILASVASAWARRIPRIVAPRRALALTPLQKLYGLLWIGIYFLLDSLAVTSLILSRRLSARWFEYQEGRTF